MRLTVGVMRVLGTVAPMLIAFSLPALAQVAPPAPAGTLFCSAPSGLATTGSTISANLTCGLGTNALTAQPTTIIAEGAVPLNFVLASTAPTLPSAVFSQFTSGILELRERITYPTSTGTLSVELFSVPTGGTLPFPSTPITAPGTVISRLDIRVQNVIATGSPSSAMLLDGTVVSGSGASVFGNVLGLPVAISLGFATPLNLPGVAVPTTTPTTPATPTTPTTPGFTPAPTTPTTPTTTTPAANTVNLISVMVAGRFTFAAPSGIGSVTFGTSTTTTITPPTTGAPVPVILVPTGPNSVAKQIALDASQSTNPGGGPLTFVWTSVGNQASINNATTATPTVQFTSGARTYTFQVVITNSQGISSTATVTINYVGF